MREPPRWPSLTRHWASHRLMVGALVVLLLVVGFAFLGPLVWPWDHLIHPEIPSNRGPSLAHPFGTSRAGHDHLAQVMRGIQQSLKVGLVVALMGAGIGTLWGAVAGWLGGWLDSVMMRFVDLLLVVPVLVVVLVLASSTTGASWLAVAVVLGAFGWLNTARVVRSLTLSLKERHFVEAAVATGASDLRIIVRHVIPNVLGVVIVEASLLVSIAILAEAAISFLGLGAAPPETSLGLLIDTAQSAAFTRPWLFWIPGLFIVLICLAVNLLGDGLRDVLDPRHRVVRE